MKWRSPAFVCAWLWLLAVAPWGAAQADLSTLLDLGEKRPAVIQAQLALAEAERVATRTDSDPLALRLERLQAEQQLARAQAELREATLDARLEIAQAWTRWREASMQTDLADAAEALAARALEIAQLRQARGSATALDVSAAQVALDDARRNRQAASNGQALAAEDLRTLTGLDSLERELAWPTLELPPRATLERGMGQRPAALQAAHALELTRVALELLDPSYASRAQIEQAQTQFDTAVAANREVDRGLSLQLQSLLNQIDSSERLQGIAIEELEQARTRETLELRRLDAGLIAAIAFEQVQLQTAQAALRARAAEHQRLLAYLELQARTLTLLEAPHAQ